MLPLFLSPLFVPEVGLNIAMENDQSIEDRLNQLAGSNGETDAVGTDSGGLDEGLDPSVSQHVIRSQADAQDVLSGQFRVSFIAGQTVEVLHVPIYPPMEKVPTVEAFGETETTRVRVTDAQRFGVRLEVKTAAVEDATREENVSEVVTVIVTSG